MVAEVDAEEMSCTTEGPRDPQTGLAYGSTGSSYALMSRSRKLPGLCLGAGFSVRTAASAVSCSPLPQRGHSGSGTRG